MTLDHANGPCYPMGGTGRFCLGEGVSMSYYIEVDELPEGTEAAKVVSDEDYEALKSKVGELESQRDEFATALEGEKRRADEASAKYARVVLDSTKRQEVHDEAKRPVGNTVESLFKGGK